MITSVKVKDNSNLGFIIIPFCLFPLIFMGIAFAIGENYLLTFIIMIFLYTIYLILILKYLKKQEEVYAITATEHEISIKDIGTFKWDEIKMIKAVPDVLFSRNRYKFMNITLQNGKKFKIETTNFDYPNHELETIFKALGKLPD
jgi:Ca2+/Na+ antiporter